MPSPSNPRRVSARPSNRRPREGPRGAQLARLRRAWFLVFSALALGLLGLLGNLMLLANAHPDGNPTEVTLVVPPNATPIDVVERLEVVGLAQDPDLAYWTLRLQGVFDQLQAGVYVLAGDSSLVEVAARLQEPAGAGHVELVLPPGLTVWQAAERIEAAGAGTAAEVVALAADHAFCAGALGLPVGPVRAPRPDGVAPTYLDGFLFPDTYFVVPGSATEATVRRLTARSREVLGQLERRYAADVALAKRQLGVDTLGLVTLASLVEREVRVAEERGTVAGVFWNRLREGMRLQTDPTLVYRPDRVGRPPTPSDRRDRTNPYNTYAFGGLPPGPIASPSRAALLAAIRPERHDLRYFVTRPDGSGRHAFSRTLEDHEARVRELRERQP